MSPKKPDIPCVIVAPPVEANKRMNVRRYSRESRSENSDRHWNRLNEGVKHVAPVGESVAYPTAERVKLDIFGSDHDEEVSSSADVWEIPTPNDPEKPCPHAVSVFQSGKFFRDHLRSFASRLWKGLQKKITMTHIDHLSSMKEEVSRLMEELKSFTKIDYPAEEIFLTSLFEKADAYDVARSKFADGHSKEAYDLQLAKAKDVLQGIREEHAAGVTQMDTTQAKLQKIKDKIGRLKRKRNEFSESLQQQQTSIRSVQARLLDAENQVFNITNTHVVDDALDENLKKSKSDLEATLEELKNF